MIDYFQILCGLLVLVLSFYYYYTATFDFWKNRNVRGPKPVVFFGNLKETAFKKVSMTEHVKNMYDQFKHEPVFGIFQGKTPTIVVTDLELIKNVLIRDFSQFSQRGLGYSRRVEPLEEHLFFLDTPRWRPLRPKFSTIFSSGNLKEMFNLILKCSNDLEKYMDKVIGNGGLVECRELAGKYTTDVIANCMFGLDISTLPNEDSEFREMGRRVFKPSKTMVVRDTLKQFVPGLYNWIGHAVQPEGVINFFTRAMLDTIKYREEKKIFRPDCINVLMDIHQNPEKAGSFKPTEQLLATQGFVFFLAGFENTSLTISHALYELAQNHEIQDKLRAEIQEDYAENGETLTYDRIRDLKYLDMVFKETLRKYPVLTTLFRENIEDYTFKGTDVTIPKGTKVWIPVYAIQNDENHYPNPEKFDPERFTKEAEAARHPMSYLPFGDGPRNCIGARFSQNQVKLGILTVIRKYKVDVCQQTTVPYQHEKRSLMLMLKGGVNLKLSKVDY
ncbi:cytochrome P450 6B1 [Megachile rotundata]|uniref:cytochrome P450 6B1 n=1 Tax=Megachile rotundata TaxID=143995 RepID=UPI000258E52C|nr:PREDICTED: cytochrome P450 6B1-like [Megachile rotundata]XP_012143065.1 PREDICTED: cytochrome P450 6B1-like [Megachile rotundata]XP_012143066.1 PREDICTED: cytochrome P450 6B1-like [Megachile rotundata]